MLRTTVEAIRSILKADPATTPGERTRILSTLRNGKDPPCPEPHRAPRLLRRKEAAGRLGASIRLVDRLAQQGLLRKVRLPGRRRAAGFLEADVQALITANAEGEGTNREAK